MPDTIRVKGYRELAKSLRYMDKESAAAIRTEFRAIGEIVRAEAAQLFSPISPSSAAGYKVRVRQKGIAVEQSLPRTTGQHPSYGTLQMRRALLPAADAHEEDTINRLEEALDNIASRAGF